MAMELEFWKPDSPNGECLDFAVRTHAWQILGFVERYRRPKDCAYIILRHTSRQQGEWVIWVRPGYVSETGMTVGVMGKPLTNTQIAGPTTATR